VPYNFGSNSLDILQVWFSHAFYATILEISVKSGKDMVSTPSLVIHRVRFKKKPAKKYISIQGRGETHFDAFLSFTVFFFSCAPPLLLHRFSLLLPVQLL
jgi:hypothetical protein